MNLIKQLFYICLINHLVLADDETPELQFKMAEYHSMMTPVAESEIKNWITIGAATMTKNRIIVNP